MSRTPPSGSGWRSRMPSTQPHVASPTTLARPASRKEAAKTSAALAVRAFVTRTRGPRKRLNAEAVETSDARVYDGRARPFKFAGAESARERGGPPGGEDVEAQGGDAARLAPHLERGH